MKKRLFLLLPLLAFLAVGTFFYSALFSDPRELESVLVGKAMPEFQLPDLLAPTQAISKQDLRKTVGEGPYLLNVWATWCPTCRAEHEYLNELAAQGVKIIGLNYKDEPSDAHLWLAQLGNPYLLNILDYEGSLAFDLGVYGAPETFIVDAQGIIKYRHVGDVNAAVWQTKLAAIYQSAGGSL